MLPQCTIIYSTTIYGQRVLFFFSKNFSVVRTRKVRQTPAYALYHRTVRRRAAKPVVSPGVNRVCLFVRPSRIAVDPTFRGSRKLANGRLPIIRCFSITGGCWSVYCVVRRSQDVTEITVFPTHTPFQGGEKRQKALPRVYHILHYS